MVCSSNSLPLFRIHFRGKKHPALDCNYNGIDKIIGVEFLFNLLKVFTDRALTDPFRLPNLFGNLSHSPTLQNRSLALRKECAWISTLASLNQPRNNHRKWRQVGSGTLCGRHRSSKQYESVSTREASVQAILQPGLFSAP